MHPLEQAIEEFMAALDQLEQTIDTQTDNVTQFKQQTVADITAVVTSLRQSLEAQ